MDHQTGVDPIFDTHVSSSTSAIMQLKIGASYINLLLGIKKVCDILEPHKHEFNKLKVKNATTYNFAEVISKHLDCVATSLHAYGTWKESPLTNAEDHEQTDKLFKLMFDVAQLIDDSPEQVTEEFADARLILDLNMIKGPIYDKISSLLFTLTFCGCQDTFTKLCYDLLMKTICDLVGPLYKAEIAFDIEPYFHNEDMQSLTDRHINYDLAFELCDSVVSYTDEEKRELERKRREAEELERKQRELEEHKRRVLWKMQMIQQVYVDMFDDHKIKKLDIGQNWLNALVEPKSEEHCVYGESLWYFLMQIARTQREMKYPTAENTDPTLLESEYKKMLVVAFEEIEKILAQESQIFISIMPPSNAEDREVSHNDIARALLVLTAVGNNRSDISTKVMLCAQYTSTKNFIETVIPDDKAALCEDGVSVTIFSM